MKSTSARSRNKPRWRTQRQPWTIIPAMAAQGYPNTDTRPAVRPAEHPNSFHWKSEVGSFTLLHKISRTACYFGTLTLLKKYNCHESATIWYTDHQNLAQYSEIIDCLQEIPLRLCNYAVLHRNMTPKSIMPTAASRTDIIFEGVPLSSQQIPSAPIRRFHLGMRTNEYRKRSDKWIVPSLKFSSEFLISCKVIFFLCN